MDAINFYEPPNEALPLCGEGRRRLKIHQPNDFRFAYDGENLMSCLTPITLAKDEGAGSERRFLIEPNFAEFCDGRKRSVAYLSFGDVRSAEADTLA